MHDIKGHIRNLWDIIPHHLPPEMKVSFELNLESALGGKDQYRGSDYRYSAIVMYQQMQGKCSSEMEDLLYTLVEISRLAYLPSLLRSPRVILRFYNVTFLHAMRCIQIFGDSPKLAKIYGIYFHAITTHLAEVCRIVSPSSLHTESEERIFGAIRGIARSTSQRGAESVRDVGIVRYINMKKLLSKEKFWYIKKMKRI